MSSTEQENNFKKRLELSEIKFRAVAETASDAIIIADRSSHIMFSNSKVEEIFGYTSKELLGQHLHKIMPEKYREAHLKGIERFLKTGVPKLIGHTIELEGLKKDGIIFPMELSLSHWKEENEDFFAGIIRDISKRKKVEDDLKNLNMELEEKVKERTEALIQKANQLKLVTNTLPAFISYVDNNEYYQYANDNYSKLIYVATSPVGKTIHQVLGDDVYSKAKPFIDKAMNGEEVQFETQLPLKDNTIKDLDVRLLPDRDQDGNVNGMVVMAMDLSERLKYEKDLNKKNEELNRINNDLDNFIYTASHDLKAPMANIEGLVSAINESESFENLPLDIKEIFKMIDESIVKFKHTIVDLTEIGQAQKSLEEKSELINIPDLIEEVLFSIKDLIDESEAIIERKLKIKEIKFSRRNFRSILYNLLSNAVKYRSSSKTPIVEIGTEVEGEYIILSVKDNGLGIPENKVDSIFKMFRRLHHDIEGTGVGLFIVKRVVENAGGKIEVKSRAGEGSKFNIYLHRNIKQN